jgi:hypothetical protein
MCRFTGSASVSNAAHGACTDTGGYIASAEIRDLINQGGNINTYYDEPSDSDILVYDDTEWVAWMNDGTKANRVAWYRGLNLGGVSDWAVDLDAGGAPVRHVSPASATVIPFPATSVAPSATFTAGGPVTTDIDNQQNHGQQNRPSGPGPNQCPVSILKQEPSIFILILTNPISLQLCDFARLITSTCCGYGGGVGNPIEISPGYALPRNLILPRGFVPNQQVIDLDGRRYPAGVPLPQEIIVPRGTRFLFPFIIPPGLSLSNRFSDGDPEPDEDDDDNGVLYITSTFWEGPPPYTVTCDPPCTLVFPPSTTSTTWTPPPFVTTTNGQSATITPPVVTTNDIRISKETVSTGPPPIKTIFPVPAPKPLCITVTLPILGTITFGLCPPDINPFPPPIPPVTVIPVPPGGKPGPTNAGNEPSEEQEEVGQFSHVFPSETNVWLIFYMMCRKRRRRTMKRLVPSFPLTILTIPSSTTALTTFRERALVAVAALLQEQAQGTRGR